MRLSSPEADSSVTDTLRDRVDDWSARVTFIMRDTQLEKRTEPTEDWIAAGEHSLIQFLLVLRI